MPEILKTIAALLTAAFGVYAFYQPDAVARASHFSLNNNAGRAELRVAYGGFFIGLGLAGILLDTDAAYQALGIGYLAAFALRLAALRFDGTEGVLSRTYYAFAVFELISGLVLTIPQ